jgi:hypothetical protein
MRFSNESRIRVTDFIRLVRVSLSDRRLAGNSKLSKISFGSHFCSETYGRNFRPIIHEQGKISGQPASA